MQLIGSPPKPNFFFQLQTDAGGFGWAGVGFGFQLLQQAGNTSLFVPHRVTHDLGGVSREHQSDVQLLKKRFQLVGWDVQAAKTFKQLAERGGFGLGRERWSERVDLVNQFLGANDALQVAVFLDALLENVDQLEIERERAGCRNRFGQVHVADERRHATAVLVAAIRNARVAELLHAQQPFGLIGRTLAA